MADGDISVLLIVKKMAGNYGLAPRKWMAQLEEIRLLPEPNSSSLHRQAPRSDMNTARGPNAQETELPDALPGTLQTDHQGCTGFSAKPMQDGAAVKILAPILLAGILGATAWEHAVHNVAVEIAVLAAGVVGAGVLWRKVRMLVAKVDAIWGAVKPLPEWQKHVDYELKRCDQRFGEAEEWRREADERRMKDGR